MKFSYKPVFCSFLALFSAVSAQASVFTVTSTADAGLGTLRQALLNANLNPGLDTITFAIPGTGPFTITPLLSLPSVTDPVVIDGTSQNGYAGTPLIEINGSSLSTATDGLLILSGGSTVKGLAINRCPRDGIRLQTLGGNVIQANFLGTDPSGTLARSNGEGGLMVNGSSANVIGGTNAAARNLLSGGNQVGLYLFTSASSNNVVSGNYIGTDVTGSLALSNVTSGIDVTTASSNLIGGTVTGSGNLISGNGQSGVYLLSGPTVSNAVVGNIIGLKAGGTSSLPNHQDGVTINGAAGTKVSGNVLSGNGNSGIFVTGAGAINNFISGNLVGTDASGAVAIAGQTNGVVLYAVSSNTVGAGNVLSGNKQYGLLIYSNAIANTIFSNHIGTSLSGLAAISNLFGGISIQQGGRSNIIGPGNLISGNTGAGVFTTAGCTNNVITGNSVGSDATGTNALANSTSGLNIQSSGNTISNNLISGNNQSGIFIFGASNNVVAGNLIGTDATGTNYLGNGYSGIACSNAPANVIGGPSSRARNIISGNFNSALNLGGVTTVHTVIQGNFIGTDLTGTFSVANRGGIYIFGSGSNLIGGSIPGAGNVISGNSLEAISVGDPGANGNIIQGNFLGVQADGSSPLGNQWHNIEFLNTASNNLVGGTNIWADNHIGYALTAQYDGVRVRPGCLGNFIQRNCIFSNTGWGIVLNNAGITVTNMVTISAVTSTTTNLPVTVYTNTPQPGLPTLGSSFVPIPKNTTTITGSMSTYANGAFYLQFYRNPGPDASGYGEGLTYLGATNITTDANGQATFTVQLPVPVTTGSSLSATATDSAGTTWEFGPDFQVQNGLQPHFAGLGNNASPLTPGITLNSSSANGNTTGTGVLTLTWPTSLTLQQTTDLTDPSTWQSVTDPTITTTPDGNSTLQTSPTQPQMFYRLVNTNTASRTAE